MEVAREVVHRLERRTLTVTVKNTKTHALTTVTLGAEDLRRMFLSELKGPALLLSLYYEHYEERAQSVIDARSPPDTDELIIGPLIDTSLGVSSRRLICLKLIQQPNS